jgi:hypothetical protein
MPMKLCDHCGEKFIPREEKQRFCSPECNRAWWVARRARAMELLRQEEERAAGDQRLAAFGGQRG